MNPRPAPPLRAIAPLLLLAVAMLFWRLADGGGTAPRRGGRTPQPEIVRATERGDVPRVAELLKEGVSANSVRVVYHYPEGTGNERNRYAPTPLLQIAVRNKNHALAELLLRQGADPNARGPYDYTALHVAAGGGNPQLVALLLARNADPSVREQIRNETPLHRAILGNFRRDANPNDANRAQVVRLLVQAGADKTAVDRTGATPGEHARRRNFSSLLAALTSAATANR